MGPQRVRAGLDATVVSGMGIITGPSGFNDRAGKFGNRRAIVKDLIFPHRPALRAALIFTLPCDP
jgi:hypothetical protein